MSVASIIFDEFTHDACEAHYGTRDIGFIRDAMTLQHFLVVDGVCRRISAYIWDKLNSPDRYLIQEACHEIHEIVMEMTTEQRGVAELGVYSFWS